MELHNLQNKEKLDFSCNKIKYRTPYDSDVIHRHTYFEIFLFNNSCGGNHKIDFIEYPIEEKTLFIVAPNQAHLLNRIKDEDGFLIQFTSDFLFEAVGERVSEIQVALKTNPKTNLKEEEFFELARICETLKKLGSSTSSYASNKLKHYFSYTLWQIMDFLPEKSEGNNVDKLSLQFSLLVEEHFSEIRNVCKYAEMLHVSLSRLNACIKHDWGKTPLQIIHEQLTLEIKRLITIERLSHKEISDKLSFDSQSSYSRFVKQHLGKNPIEISKSLKK